LMQLLRELKEIHGNSSSNTIESWMQTSAVA
jgi:hypothetical protein